MPVYTGRKVAIGLAPESTRGTKAAPVLYYMHTSFKPQNKVEYKESGGMVGTLAKNHKKSIISEMAELPIKWNVGIESIGYFLLAMLGSVTSAETTGTGAYKHTFNFLNDNISPTFTVSENNGVESLAYPLASIEKLAFDFKQDDFIKLDSTWKSRKAEDTALTVSYTDEQEFTGREVSVYFADTLAGLDGATAICVESGSMELVKEVEQVFCLGGLWPKDVITKNIDFQSSLTIRHKDKVFTQYNEDSTHKAMRIRIKDSNTTIGVSDNPTIDIDVAKVTFDDVVKEWEGDDIARQNITISS